MSGPSDAVRIWLCMLAAALFSACASSADDPRAWRRLDERRLSEAQIDSAVHDLMARADVPGLALALIRDGHVVHRRAYGMADVQAGAPLRTDSVMYGASLTKAAFAYLVMQLVDEGLIDLDAALPAQLKKPLPDYPGFADLATDRRWQRITPRMLLSHSSGFLNWRSINDDKKLDLKFDPGSRYIYSGEGIQLLQLIVEERSGRSVGDLMHERVFQHFGMTRTSLTWRDDFAALATRQYGVDGRSLEHVRRQRTRAAGSMDTTLDDFSHFVAGVMAEHTRGQKSVAQMLSPQIRIVSPRQFPSHWPGETTVNEGIALSAGLGWVVYRSSHGPAFFKEGNDDGTNNFVLGFSQPGVAIVMLSNSARADSIFFPLAERLLGPTCMPWFWMGYIPYDRPGLRRSGARERPVAPSCESG